MKKVIGKGVGLSLLVMTVPGLLSAAPVDDTLSIDDEIEMTTRTQSAEGHPIDEVISGWHYRTEETRALEADSFQNPGMLVWHRVRRSGIPLRAVKENHVPVAITMQQSL